jgi:CheY-like chemotaxis protein
VAKILVADDNSNIQRMVGLALKDQGIDVVAVGNGEAAVRKISELRPDLVLADVFMPVRNGYEVCQYVKEDSSLAHIPVILLVGAFDPLDEQEAQRVGADGVLKKPFVPPDPLIAMVKAALQRAGISLTPAGAEKVSTPPPRKAADLLPPAPQPPARVSPLAGVAFSSTPAPGPIAPIVGDESFVDEPALPEPVRIDATKHTMAFGNLLGATATSEDSGLAAEDTETATGSDWRSLDEPHDVPEEEQEEAKESPPSWRRDEAETVFEDDGSGIKDWRDSAAVQTVGRQSARETWEQAEDKSGFEAAAKLPTEMGAFASEMSALEAESVVANTQETHVPDAVSEVAAQSDFARGPETFSTNTKAVAAEAAVEMPPMNLPWVAATEESAPADVNGEVTGTGQAVEVLSEPAAEVPSNDVEVSDEKVAVSDAVGENEAVAVSDPADLAASLEPVAQPEPVVERAEENAPEPVAINSWFSRPASPWDTDAHRTNPLAASWETSNKVAASEATPAVVDNATEARSTNGQSSHEEVVAVISEEPVAQTAPANAEKTTEVDTDALVAKVLARMSPDVLQALSREILKPMVAALLEQELKNKK